MKKSIVFGMVATTLLLIGCGGDKKVEEKAVQTQVSTPAMPEANASMTHNAPSADGKQVFSTRCAACHGEKGEGKATYPKLAGNTKEEALKKLKGYVDGSYGKEQKIIMIGQAKGISDAQKEAVAEYISTLK